MEMKRNSFTRIYQRPTGTYYSSITAVPEECTVLVYDNLTKVIYYLPLDCTYMCPYISVHGKYCRFVNNEFVEIG